MSVQYLNLVANLANVAVTFFTALVALIALFKARKIMVLVDGQLTELKTLIASSSKAEGVLEGKADEKANPS